MENTNAQSLKRQSAYQVDESNKRAKTGQCPLDEVIEINGAVVQSYPSSDIVSTVMMTIAQESVSQAEDVPAVVVSNPTAPPMEISPNAIAGGAYVSMYPSLSPVYPTAPINPAANVHAMATMERNRTPDAPVAPLQDTTAVKMLALELLEKNGHLTLHQNNSQAITLVFAGRRESGCTTVLSEVADLGDSLRGRSLRTPIKIISHRGEEKKCILSTVTERNTGYFSGASAKYEIMDITKFNTATMIDERVTNPPCAYYGEHVDSLTVTDPRKDGVPSVIIDVPSRGVSCVPYEKMEILRDVKPGKSAMFFTIPATSTDIGESLSRVMDFMKWKNSGGAKMPLIVVLTKADEMNANWPSSANCLSNQIRDIKKELLSVKNVQATFALVSVYDKYTTPDNVPVYYNIKSDMILGMENLKSYIKGLYFERYDKKILEEELATRKWVYAKKGKELEEMSRKVNTASIAEFPMRMADYLCVYPAVWRKTMEEKIGEIACGVNTPNSNDHVAAFALSHHILKTLQNNTDWFWGLVKSYDKLVFDIFESFKWTPHCERFLKENLAIFREEHRDEITKKMKDTMKKFMDRETMRTYVCCAISANDAGSNARGMANSATRDYMSRFMDSVILELVGVYSRYPHFLEMSMRSANETWKAASDEEVKIAANAQSDLSRAIKSLTYLVTK